MTRSEELDVIIVGAGPAGLCAAIYAGRGMLRSVLLERGVPGGELLNTEWIDDYPGFEHVLGQQLADLMTTHAIKFGADIRQEPVEAIVRREDGIFEVATGMGRVYEAPAVILTAGGTPTKLEVSGEVEYAGRGVSYCAVCDGAFFKGEILAVVGGGDAAVEEADYLTRYGAKVYVIHRRGEFRASKLLQERLFANPKIEVIWNKRVREFKGGPAGLQSVELLDMLTGEHSSLAATGAFIFIGFRPNTGLVKQHAEHDPNGYLVTDDRMMTSIPGLFAAGDVRAQLTRQITTAVGDATTAAIAVEKYLTDRRSRLELKEKVATWWRTEPPARP
jgi:thioredoxin reductase (NADPH)